MSDDRDLGRGVGFPPRLGADGRMTMSAGERNIRESIRIALLTEPGERLFLPDFGAGLSEFLFEPNTTATRRRIEERITGALENWEPRIRLTSVTVTPDPDDPQAVVARIAYRLVATGAAGEAELAIGTA